MWLCYPWEQIPVAGVKAILMRDVDWNLGRRRGPSEDGKGGYDEQSQSVRIVDVSMVLVANDGWRNGCRGEGPSLGLG